MEGSQNDSTLRVRHSSGSALAGTVAGLAPSLSSTTFYIHKFHVSLFHTLLTVPSAHDPSIDMDDTRDRQHENERNVWSASILS